MIFLKLGGSLITDKERPETAQIEIISNCAEEIAEVWNSDQRMSLVLGHGSGSFGHHHARRFMTHEGAKTFEEWRGFSVVWASANRLNRVVIDALRAVKLPVISFPPSSYMVCEQGHIIQSFIEPIQRALSAGLIPVVQGDVAFDRSQGSCILSTELVLESLAESLKFNRILLAGKEPGVLSTYPEGNLLQVINQTQIPEIEVKGSSAQDVTGGMAGKIKHALALSRLMPEAEVRIFSGEQRGAIKEALQGSPTGTLVRYQAEPK